MNKALAAAGILAVTAGALVSGCSSSSSSSPPSSSAAVSSGDCMFGVFGADVEVGIAHPTRSCLSWMHSLAGNGVTWYPIAQMVKVGSPDDVDTDTMGETCDLTDGTQELFVEDGGEMPYGDGTCTKEEQAGWKAEASPGPLALQAQSAAA